ncbi:MAG TPA: ribosome maturation factor RimP [Paenalcaligenes sp.]|nr:ribosome maturation factor RimP [Paenalcaligenes sp.]
MTDIFALAQEALLGTEFELVDVERGQGGLLRVVIDHPEGVNVDHCETVSRQLSRVFEVEDVDYHRLEVASPGVNRPLRRLGDYVRFSGERVELRLYESLENQKVFRGVLHAPDGVTADEASPETEFVLEVETASGGVRDLTFCFDDVERARLDPILDFRGKRR